MDASPPPDLMDLPVKCVDLPQGNNAPPQPSLQNVGEPRILWQKSYEDTRLFGLSGSLALAGERLAFISGPGLWLLDRGGSLVAHLMEGPAWAASAQGPVADKDGNFYFSTESIFSVKPDGTIRWTRGLGPNQSPFEELTLTSGLLLSPANNLYFAATDGFYYAIHAEDGSTLWSRPVSAMRQDEFYYNGLGADGHVFADLTYDALTGEVSGLPLIDGIRANGVPEYSGFYTTHGWYQGDKAVNKGFFMDNCGKLLWSLPNQVGSLWYFPLFGFNGEILVRGSEEYEDGRIYIYSKTGAVLRGPMPVSGLPQVLGADGTFYSLDCPMPEQVLTLSTYSWDSLERQWSLDLGKGCSNSGAVLADDGVLYLARSAGSGDPVEVIAVQTASPGLAHTSQPNFPQYNNRRTGWLE